LVILKSFVGKLVNPQIVPARIQYTLKAKNTRKRIVKVDLSVEQKEILEELSKRLGTSKSERASLMKERVRKQVLKSESDLNSA